MLALQASSFKGRDTGDRYATIAIVLELGFLGSPIPENVHKLWGVGTEGQEPVDRDQNQRSSVAEREPYVVRSRGFCGTAALVV